MQQDNFFKGIHQVETKAGTYTVRYPVFYRDVSYCSFFLMAPLEKIRDLLPSKRMHPFRLTPWHSMFTITATEYKVSDLGPYNQVSVGIPFVWDKPSPVFTGILHKVPETPMIYTVYLPVSTEQALITGIEMARYPEFSADIQFSKEADWIHCKVDAEGKNLMNLSCRVIPVKPVSRQHVCPVTLFEDRLLRSDFIFAEASAAISKKQSDVNLLFGDHLVGQKLQHLHSGKLLQYQYYPKGCAILTTPSEGYSTAD